MEKLKIVGIGEIVWDMLPSAKQLGGAPVNFAFYAKELGSQSAIISAIGRDELGSELMSRLRHLGMDIRGVRENRYPTSTVDIALSADGIPTYHIRENVAWDYLENSELTQNIISDADAICWGSLAQRSETSRKSIMQMIEAAPKDCLKVFDINIRLNYFSASVVQSSIEQADVLKLNEDELPKIAEMFSMCGDELNLLSSLVDRFELCYLIYTKGAECSMIMNANHQVSKIETPPTMVEDTVGAGDSFTAAFVSYLLQGCTMEEAHCKAVQIAAFVCTQAGATAPLPEGMF